MNTEEIRQKIEQLVSQNQAAGAQRLLGELLRAEPTASAASFVVRQYEELRPQLKLLPHRIAILRSFTVEPVVPLLRAAAFESGIDLTVHLSDFNAYVQEIVDPGSALYRFAPDSVVLAVQSRDLVPALWSGFPLLSPEDVRHTVEQATAHLRQWVQTLRLNTRAHLIVHSFEQPPFPAAGLLDAQAPAGQRAALEQINCALQTLCAAQTNTYVLDYSALVARHGSLGWHDERKWLTVRLPVASQHLNDLAREWLRFLHPLTGKVAKVLRQN